MRLSSTLNQGLKYALRSQKFRSYLRRFFSLYLEVDMKSQIEDNKPDNLTWQNLEPIYIQTRRKLVQSEKWRYGQIFVKDNIKLLVNKLMENEISIQGKVYCDLGCGSHHPYGTSTLMYINGAASAIAMDLKDTNKKRAAEALYDLLLSCLAHPDDYHWSDIKREEYFSRIYSFNLKALCEGNLKVGLASIPIKHLVTNIYEPAIQPQSIDIMSSRAVLEHFLDFDSAAHQIYSLMSPGGVAHHLVDFVDHRAYSSAEYHWWSFLAEDEQRSYSSNRLRPSEIYDSLEKVGFKVLDYYDISKEPMPKGFRKQLKGRFASMTDEELGILRACYLIKRPG